MGKGMRNRDFWILCLCLSILWNVSVVLTRLDLDNLVISEYQTFHYGVRDFFADFARINFNIFSKESLLVAFGVAPVYGLFHEVDQRIHRSIYDSYCHKNLFDIGSCHKIFLEDMGMLIPVIGLSGGLLASADPNNKITGSLLLSGLASVWLVKDAIKRVAADCEVCCRPYSSLFAKKRMHNGFPSGHAAIATYLTLLFAFRKGIKWAFPIGVYSGVIVGLLVGCNYHYASQVVAGIGLGTIYALSANKVAQSRLSENWEINFRVNRSGSPQFSVEYSF